MPETDPLADAEAHRQAQAKEYGQYVAVQTIDIGYARAFNVGDAIPASHVERGLVPEGSYAKSTTKAAAAAIEKG
jgi:hypothetical protein